MKKFTDKINESVEERIPTTEQFFEKYSSSYQFEEGDPEYLIDKLDFKEVMIEFAKLHVEAALKEAVYKAETITIDVHGQDTCNIDEDSILNSYPLDNIK